MKKALNLITLLVITLSISSSQGFCELELLDKKLSGTCKNSYFTNFEIWMDDNVLDSTRLFNQLPLSGIVVVNRKHKSEVQYELTNRAGFPQILFKTRFGWFTFDSLILAEDKLTFSIDHDPAVPVTELDLKIIRKTKELLSEEKSWHKNDDRDCKDDINNARYSLFCALKTASIDIEGDYNHRNAIMQKIRHTIVEIYPLKEWEHRLKDFNNMPETDFGVLMDLLNRVEEEVITELELK
jgi:hypothetical protein